MPYRALINTFLLIHFLLIYVVFYVGYLIFYVKLVFVATLVKYFGFVSNICGFRLIFYVFV